MKKFYILLTAALAFAACTYEIDDVFEKSSAERISEEMARTKELLQSPSNGWLMYYYGSTQYGGYNVLCKFGKDDNVTVQSEIYGEKTATSHYKIEQSQGVLLSFDEYNEVFHFFSDPANPAGIGINGTGMEGDFEFRVISAGTDEIVLSGKKHGSKVVMVPMADADWDAYLEGVLDIEETMSAAFYTLQLGDTAVTASSSYRRLTFYDEENDANVYVPFCFTDKGMKLYSTLSFAGVNVDELFYSAAEDKCYSADKTVSVEAQAVPLSEAIVLNDWFFSAEGASEKVLNAFNTCKAGSASEGEVIAYWFLGRKDDASPYGLVFYSGDFSNGFYVGTFSLASEAVDDDTIKFSVTAEDGNAQWYKANCGYGTFVNMLNATFKLSTDNPRKPSYIRLEDVSDSSIWMNVYADEKLLPFGE